MKPRLQLSLVSETYPPEVNGVAHTLGHLARGLAARGHRVQLVRPRQAEEQPADGIASQVLVRGWPLPGSPGLQWGRPALRRLLRSWTRQRPDVVYIATEGPLGLSALRAARRLGIPVVSGFHTNFALYCEHHGLGLLTRPLTGYLRWFHNRSQLTLVPSPSQHSELSRRGFERLALLARGVDAELFHPARRCSELRRQWGLGEQDIAVLHVGRLSGEKNLQLLAETYGALCRQHPQRRLRLVIVGDGPEAPTLRAQLPDALFCGLQRGELLARHYACGDLFIFPSLCETFGNVVLEALASGLAVVAFDRAAAAQHIRHGHSGMLAMPGDEPAFIEAACALLEDDERLRSLRLNARWHASRQGWAQIVEGFEQQLLLACQDPQGKPGTLHPMP